MQTNKQIETVKQIKELMTQCKSGHIEVSAEGKVYFLEDLDNEVL